MDFDTAFDRLIGNEGSLSLDPRDRGNWTGGRINLGICKGTKFGISAATYPQLDIANLTSDQARAIYLKDYWQAAQCDLLPDGAKFDTFDMAVNSGVKSAIMTLQRALGITADGVVGQETKSALQNLNPVSFHALFNGARLHFLTGALSDDQWATQGRGLVNRVGNNLMGGA